MFDPLGIPVFLRLLKDVFVVTAPHEVTVPEDIREQRCLLGRLLVLKGPLVDFFSHVEVRVDLVVVLRDLAVCTLQHGCLLYFHHFYFDFLI